MAMLFLRNKPTIFRHTRDVFENNIGQKTKINTIKKK